MKTKLISLSDAVIKYVKDRSVILSGGFPMSRNINIFTKEILRQRRKGSIQANDLIWMSSCIGFSGDIMVAEGIVDVIISSFSSHERPGLSKIVRDSLEKGLPRKVKWEDESNLTLNLKVMAAALNLPFIPSNSGIWGDINRSNLWNGSIANPKNIVMEDPYGSRQKVALLQAIKPDLAVVHVPFADTKGNGIILGSLYYDFWTGRAGKDIILIADHIVDTEMCRRFPNLVTIPGVGVSAVIPWYMGSWPANCPGLYGEDLEHMTGFIQSSSGAVLKYYLEKYVYSWEGHDEFMALIGDSKIKSLEDNPSRILSEPFMQWILPREKIDSLMNN